MRNAGALRPGVSSDPMVELLRPAAALLPAYAEALRRGWSPDNLRDVATEQLAAIADDPAGFLAGLDDPAPAGRTVTLPDGSKVPRLPAITRWIVAGGFAGAIALRWQPGTEALPAHVLGHIGYSVVPWARGRGHASAALALILPEARALGLRRVELTVSPANPASIRVIEKNGGRLAGRFEKPASHGGGATLRYTIAL